MLMRNTLLLRRAVDGSSVTRSAQSFRQIQQKKEIIVKTKQLLLIVILGALLLAACGSMDSSGGGVAGRASARGTRIWPSRPGR